MSTSKMSLVLLSLVGTLQFSAPASATVKNPRVVWDTSPATQAVISFSRNGTAASTAQVIKYGTSTDESTWQNQSTITRTFKSSLVNYIGRLNNLTPNTEYFFRVCDASGCLAPHFFRTAPADDRSLTVIAGGDSRTDRTMRQRGNRMVQKIRPHFIMFSGDYTDDHAASEMDTWLTDWQLTFTPATINGVAYKQVYPLLPTVGNHEASDTLFMCSIFGVDGDANGACTLRDTYNATSVGTLVRVYTLNSEFSSSQSNDRTAQRSWLNADLPSHQTDVRWRFAQYHRPMYPRTTDKPTSTANTVEFLDAFDSFKMNLANESDSHIVKITYPVHRSGSNYAKVDAGTVYIGEGAWGAPIRPADRDAAWVVDLDSFPYVQILSLTSTTMQIRTARIANESTVAILDKAARDADPLVLPSGLTLWDADDIGTVYKLKQDAQGRTQIDAGVVTPPTEPPTEPPTTPPTGTTTLPAVRDVEVGDGGHKLNGSTITSDGLGGGEEIRALLGWDLSSLPANTTVKSARIELTVTDASSGTHNFYAARTAWTEAGATFSSATITSAVKIGSVVPSSTGTVSITLNAAGLDIVRGWINGSALNNGIVIDPNTPNSVVFKSRESGTPARLVITH